MKMSELSFSIKDDWSKKIIYDPDKNEFIKSDLEKIIFGLF